MIYKKTRISNDCMLTIYVAFNFASRHTYDILSGYMILLLQSSVLTIRLHYSSYAVDFAHP